MSEDLFNFRDLGGLETHCARKVRHGQLFRVGNLGDITANAADYLVETQNVKTYVDFRTMGEIERFGSPKPLVERGVEWINLQIDTHDPIFNGLTRPEPEDWLGLYIRLFQKNANEWVRFIKIIKEAKGGVIYGCLFGKDRTGIATSMLLQKLNVRDEHILHDYSRSSQGLIPHYKRLQVLWEDSPLTPEEQFKYFLNTPKVIIEEFIKFYRSQAMNELKHILSEIGEADKIGLQQKLLEPVKI